MKSNIKPIVTYSFLLAWLITCLTLYVYVSRISYVPIVDITNWPAFISVLRHVSPLRYILDLLGAIVGVIGFSIASLSFGLAILQKWIPSQSSRLALGVTAFLVGEILFSVIFLTTISLHRLTPLLVAIITLFGFLLGIIPLRTFFAPLRFPRHLATGFVLGEQMILIMLVIGLILSLLLSSTRLGYDAAVEYFSHAKIMAVTQLPIFFNPNLSFVVSSLHPGILFTVLIQLFGDQCARLLSWINAVSILLMGLAIARELGLTKRAQLWFLTLVMTSTAFVDLPGDGKIELISTTPILAATYWVINNVERPTKGRFALVGLLTGFAIISRPYNIFLVSVFFALFIAIQVFAQYYNNRSEFKCFMQSSLWMVLPLLALGAFHLFQNWIWLKDPVAPLTYARELDSSGWQWQMDPADLAFYRLFYPFTLTFLNSPQSLGNLSPLLVGFLPFLFVKNVRKNLQFSPLLRRLTVLAVLTLLLWITFFFTILEIRYVLFLWVILFLPMAQVLESITQQIEMWIRPLVMPLVIVLLAVLAARTLLISFIAYLPSAIIDKTDCYDTNLCRFVETINQRAAPGDRVFVLHAYRYYLRPDLFVCSSRMNEYHALQPLAVQKSSEFWVDVYRRGYQFIMFEKHLSEDRYRFGKLPNLDTAPDWLQIKVLYASPSAHQLIYQLEAVDPPILPEISCKQDSQGKWQLISSNASSSP